MRDGALCEWVGVTAATPRPGFQTLVYRVGRSTLVVDLRVKDP
jgi:hypothetical protein